MFNFYAEHSTERMAIHLHHAAEQNSSITSSSIFRVLEKFTMRTVSKVDQVQDRL